MMNYKKQKMVSVPEPKLAKDPRSATVSNIMTDIIKGMYNDQR